MFYFDLQRIGMGQRQSGVDFLGKFFYLSLLLGGVGPELLYLREQQFKVVLVLFQKLSQLIILLLK